MPATSLTKILVFGTFDILHEGHLDFFKQARALAEHPYLIVSIARDGNVLRIKKAPAWYTEGQRLAAVQASELVDNAVLGAEDEYLNHILALQPDIIALGYDQEHYTHNLEENLRNRGLCVIIKRLQPYKDSMYKSSLLKAKGDSAHVPTS